jgi:glucose-1-phosphate cytidylyltransferase
VGRAPDRADPGAGGAAVKVVLFCGGLGLRMGETTARIPKPMIPVGERPILWHIMKYYASWGFRDFILCLGYKADVIKEYFLKYEALANDFVLHEGGKRIQLLQSDIHDWSITFVDTGLQSSIGERLRRVRPYLDGDEMFLANYGDTLTDAPLPDMIDTLRTSDKTGIFLCARPTYNYHVVRLGDENAVQEIVDVTTTDTWVNAGYFVFRPDVFDAIGEGEDLVEEPFRRLIAHDRLVGYPYEGFWAPMDTLKDKQTLDMLYETGRAPWRLPLVPDATDAEPVGG